MQPPRVFRIFQEVLTNVLRHSHAHNIYVKLCELQGIIELEVGTTDVELQNLKNVLLVGLDY